MNVNQINEALSRGEVHRPEVLPHLEDLKNNPFQFKQSFGLDHLPHASGVIIIRGPRQYGKSTWLEEQIYLTVKEFGPGSAFYLNGDEISDFNALSQAIRELRPLFNKNAFVRRLFIDEITAIPQWEKSLKRLIDGGELKDVLVVTTGSRAVDLRRGTERLPGRKGKLDRSSYYFTPISYFEFKRVCGSIFKEKCWIAYILTGGCPIACSELAQHGKIPEAIPEMIRDWVYGECAQAGRNRQSLLAVLDCLNKFGGNPVGQSKLAREAGLANNTVAEGYIGLLGDLLCVLPSYAWDESKKNLNRKKPCKYQFINLLVALTWHPSKIRTVADFESLSEEEQGKWIEWAVAQEVWRRSAVSGEELKDSLSFWQSKKHELDFVIEDNRFIEVKRGKSGPIEFSWFHPIFPCGQLTIVNREAFETQQLKGISLENFLLAGP